MIKEALTVLISDGKQIQWPSDCTNSIIRHAIGIHHKRAVENESHVNVMSTFIRDHPTLTLALIVAVRWCLEGKNWFCYYLNL
jgi:hypothetical protein